VQGYLIARPMSEDAYRGYLTDRQANGGASSVAVLREVHANHGRGAF
jgi:hypothetical protein